MRSVITLFSRLACEARRVRCCAVRRGSQASRLNGAFAMVLFLAMPVWAEKPKYVMAKAYHVLPETTSEESGYFSLCEGLDGNMYVGTAKYNQDAYLVE